MIEPVGQFILISSPTRGFDMIMITESQPLVYQPSEEHDLLVNRSLVELLVGRGVAGWVV